MYIFWNFCGSIESLRNFCAKFDFFKKLTNKFVSVKFLCWGSFFNTFIIFSLVYGSSIVKESLTLVRFSSKFLRIFLTLFSIFTLAKDIIFPLMEDLSRFKPFISLRDFREIILLEENKEGILNKDPLLGAIDLIKFLYVFSLSPPPSEDKKIDCALLLTLLKFSVESNLVMFPRLFKLLLDIDFRLLYDEFPRSDSLALFMRVRNSLIISCHHSSRNICASTMWILSHRPFRCLLVMWAQT